MSLYDTIFFDTIFYDTIFYDTICIIPDMVTGNVRMCNPIKAIADIVDRCAIMKTQGGCCW